MFTKNVNFDLHFDNWNSLMMMSQRYNVKLFYIFWKLSEMSDKMLPFFGISYFLELCTVTDGCKCEEYSSFLCQQCLRATMATLYLTPFFLMTLVFPSKPMFTPTSALCPCWNCLLSSFCVQLRCHLLHRTFLSF